MRKKRIMVIGPRNCGKTTLVNYINGYEGPLRKTQDTIYTDTTIDVPSAYIENAWMYKHIIALAQDALCIVLMVDQSRTTEVYSHGFARNFRCPVIGVISKCDLKPENRETCIKQLENIGCEPPFIDLSVTEGKGLDELEKHILEIKKGKGLDEVHN
ncbi:MAG: ethanolamine utilization protein EutP [Eubacterium sp.]|nr:ethanolamine utilization protein EutP [Candidatus Colimonas fimequi]